MNNSTELFFEFLNRLGEKIFGEFEKDENKDIAEHVSRDSLDDFIIFCHEDGMSLAQIGLAIENDRAFCKKLGINYVTLGEPWKATDYASKIIGNYQLDQQLLDLQKNYNQQS